MLLQTNTSPEGSHWLFAGLCLFLNAGTEIV